MATTAAGLARQQTELAAEELGRWQSSSDWVDLTDEDRTWFASEADHLTIEPEGTLDGLKKLLSHDYSLHHRLRDLAAGVARKAAEGRAAKVEQPEPKPAPQTAEAEVLVAQGVQVGQGDRPADRGAEETARATLGLSAGSHQLDRARIMVSRNNDATKGKSTLMVKSRIRGFVAFGFGFQRGVVAA